MSSEYAFDRPTENEREYQAGGTSYTLRGLRPTEIGVWAEFCASVFAYKDNPPHSSYFSRHFISDRERRSSSWIRVAVNGERIVASCRVFFRRISVGDQKTLTGAGIGEVCTDTDHRRRGLSKQLLLDAFSIIENENTFDFSFLHAAETFFDFYRSAGYSINAISYWHTAVIDRNLLATRAEDSSLIRTAMFPRDVDQLMKLHQLYSEQRVKGSIVRSHDYWTDYVSEELKGNLHVLYEKQSSGEERIIGWLSLRLRNDDGKTTKLQLGEFGCADPERNCYSILVELLNYAVVCISMKEKISLRFRLHLPKLVLEDARRSCAGESLFAEVAESNDHGWMYKPLVNPDTLSQIVTQNGQHLIWPTDSF